MTKARFSSCAQNARRNAALSGCAMYMKRFAPGADARSKNNSNTSLVFIML
jgi:hypothetical protein